LLLIKIDWLNAPKVTRVNDQLQATNGTVPASDLWLLLRAINVNPEQEELAAISMAVVVHGNVVREKFLDALKERLVAVM
jgi:flagellar biosynthesis regulator FlbT